jgi:hypothetical protein
MVPGVAVSLAESFALLANQSLTSGIYLARPEQLAALGVLGFALAAIGVPIVILSERHTQPRASRQGEVALVPAA